MQDVRMIECECIKEGMKSIVVLKETIACDVWRGKCFACKKEHVIDERVQREDSQKLPDEL